MAERVAAKRRKPQNVTVYAPAKWEPAFLAALRVHGVVSPACDAAKVNRRTVYHRRDNYPEFARLWDEAIQDFADSLESEAVRRARDGIVKGIYHQGVLMSTELQYSDALMSQMLKAKRPDEYGDKLTLKIDPDHAALLKKLGLSASDLWLQMMQELANADAS